MKKIMNNQYKHEYDGGWIGVDFDGTLAEYHGWKGELKFGKPIMMMVERVKTWRAEGVEVRIMTARASHKDKIKLEATIEEVISAIQDWCEKYIGERLPVTCEKDYLMIELWDDRAVQLETNTGIAVEQMLEDCRGTVIDLEQDVGRYRKKEKKKERKKERKKG